MSRKLAGVAQHSELRPSLPDGAGENPAPRSTLRQALAAGLQLDPDARALGHADGKADFCRLSEEDLLYNPGRIDLLAYLTGFAEGQRNWRKARSS